jgi:hypothetical protein
VPVALDRAARWTGAGGANREPSAGQRERSLTTNAALRPRSSSPAAPRTLVELNPAGPPVKVTQERRPDNDPTLCVFGHANVCVKRPGAPVSEPTLPQVP